MEPFATIADLNARRASDLTRRAASVAEVKLADASAKLAAEMDASGIPWRTRVVMGAEPFASNLRAVCLVLTVASCIVL